MAASLDGVERAVVFLDFDGVLAEIVSEPSDARPLPGTRKAIRALQDSGFDVFLLSSRDVDFLIGLFSDVDGLNLIGSAGIELWSGGQSWVKPSAAEVKERVEHAYRHAVEHSPDGVEVERKNFSLSLHYRNRPEAMDEAIDFGRRLARSFDLHLNTEAKMVVELGLPFDFSKGRAIEETVLGIEFTHLGPIGNGNQPVYQWALFAGDDNPDIEGFNALESLRRRFPDFRSLAIGVASGEQPRGFLEAVDFVVDGPPGAQEMLSQLARCR